MSFFAKTAIRFIVDAALTKISVSLLPQRVQHLQSSQQFQTIGPQSFAHFFTKYSVVAPNKQGLVVDQRFHTPFAPIIRKSHSVDTRDHSHLLPASSSSSSLIAWISRLISSASSPRKNVRVRPRGQLRITRLWRNQTCLNPRASGGTPTRSDLRGRCT